jgi:two-component system nitrogen regulation response regulator NtrX
MQELEPETWERLKAYDWPGNIREVRNVLERILVLSPDGRIHPDDIPSPGGRGQGMEGETGIPPGTPLADAMEICKRQVLRRTLEECGGNQTRAAELLDIHRSSLNRMLKELDLR